jgi:hypothetical protein
MGEWQPIETAPKDGTPVLLHGRFRRYRRGWTTVLATWSTFSSRPDATDHDWISGLSRVDADWTHWMPLPAPPPRAEG